MEENQLQVLLLHLSGKLRERLLVTVPTEKSGKQDEQGGVSLQARALSGDRFLLGWPDGGDSILYVVERHRKVAPIMVRRVTRSKLQAGLLEWRGAGRNAIRCCPHCGQWCAHDSARGHWYRARSIKSDPYEFASLAVELLQ